MKSNFASFHIHYKYTCLLRNILWEQSNREFSAWELKRLGQLQSLFLKESLAQENTVVCPRVKKPEESNLLPDVLAMG